MDVKEKGMQKKMFIVIAAVAAVAIVAVVLMLALGRKEETYRSIKIIELEGGVTIEREGVGTLEASSNMNLISGDAVKTEQDAYAVLQLVSDKYVMLAESGSMTVVAEGDEANSRTAIQLDSGSVLNEIQNPLSSGSSYDIVTPSATMSVRGTVFEVRRNGDDSTGDIEVLVYDGKVAVGLDGMDSSLYEAGEYTQFTAGQDPQFIVERTEITEEHLNPQFMERLEQINSQSRELNLGTAQLASAQTKDDAEPKQTPAVAEPVATPAQTEAPATPAPSATPAATPKPVKTPAPQAAVQTPSVTAPVETPVVETPEPDDDNDDDDEQPVQPAQPEPPVQPAQPEPPVQLPQNPGESTGNTGDDGNNGNTGDDGNNQGNVPWDINDKQNFWQKYTLEDYKQAAAGNPAVGTECTVFYYVPKILEAKDLDGDGKLYSLLDKTSPEFTTVSATVGSKLTEPANPVNESGLTFMGWYLEGSTAAWDFENDVVEANMCLYAVWCDGTGPRYFPVICRSEMQHCYYCNSVAEGSYLKELTLSVSGNSAFQGWKNVLDGSDWNLEDSTVQGIVSLKASWSN